MQNAACDAEIPCSISSDRLETLESIVANINDIDASRVYWAEIKLVFQMIL